MEKQLSRAELHQFIKEDLEQFEREVEAHPERYDPHWIEARKRAKQANELLVQRLWERARVRVDGIDDFQQELITREEYHRAIPVLLEALEDAEMEPIHEGIVWALTKKEARGIVFHPLLEQFEKIEVPGDEQEATRQGLFPLWHLKWTIGNALGYVADKGVANEIVALLRDKRHGGTRSELVHAIARLKPLGTVELLMELLDDEDDLTALRAAQALGRMGVKAAREKIAQRFAERMREDSWYRQRLRRVLERLDRVE